jgi:hypothetical protein
MARAFLDSSAFVGHGSMFRNSKHSAIASNASSFVILSVPFGEVEPDGSKDSHFFSVLGLPVRSSREQAPFSWYLSFCTEPLPFRDSPRTRSKLECWNFLHVSATRDNLTDKPRIFFGLYDFAYKPFSQIFFTGRFFVGFAQPSHRAELVKIFHFFDWAFFRERQLAGRPVGRPAARLFRLN